MRVFDGYVVKGVTDEDGFRWWRGWLYGSVVGEYGESGCRGGGRDDRGFQEFFCVFFGVGFHSPFIDVYKGNFWMEKWLGINA